MIKLLLVILIIIILIFTITTIIRYEPIAYDLEINGTAYGYCIKNTCYGIITNNGTINNVNEVT